MPEFDWSMLLAALALLFAGVGWAGAVRINRRSVAQQRKAVAQQQALEQRLELLQQSINGLISAAAGVDRRMRKLELREKVLTERQETYENQQIEEQPYGQAIRLVQKGAGVHRLVDELDLSESEADLIVRLHGHRDTA